MSARLPRCQRLSQARDFAKLFRRSKRSSDDLVTVLARSNGGETPRLGMAISRKCAPKAVDRNRIKRVIRESFRHAADELQGLDLVVIGKRTKGNMDSRRLAQSLHKHWRRVSEKCKRC